MCRRQEKLMSISVSYTHLDVYKRQAVYRDQPISQLTQALFTGPAKGILTTPESAEKYEDIVADIRTQAPQEGRIMMHELLPFGYLCVENKPALPSLWRTHLPEQRVDLYYEKYPDHRPALIYSAKPGYGISNGELSAEDASRILGGEMESYETSCAECFILKEK